MELEYDHCVDRSVVKRMKVNTGFRELRSEMHLRMPHVYFITQKRLYMSIDCDA